MTNIHLKNPLVSVLMTVYNRMAYIGEAIESVLASTYQNFELIIVDDCSTDESFDIAKQYAAKDPRIKLFKNDHNLGQFQNRNKAASYASGEYLKYLDSDDLIYPHGLEVMVRSLDRFPKAAFAIMHNKPEDIKPYPFEISSRDAFKEQFLGRGVMDMGPSGMIFRTTCFREAGGFKEDGYVGNDTEILFRLAQKYPIVKLPTSLIWWRRHEGQAFSQGHMSNEYLFTHFRLILGFLNSPESPLSEKETEKAIKRQKQHHARKLLALAILQKQPKLAWTAFSKSGLTMWELLQGFKPYENHL